LDNNDDAGGWRTENNPRMMADVNGDGLADVVGFANDGVDVAISNGTGFNQSSRWVDGFGYDAGGWTEDKYPRVMADVNGDGLADVVGFGDRGVIIATSNGNSFNPPSEWVHGLSQYYGWYVWKNPRMMADVNGDGLVDVVGFGNDGVDVAISNGTGFNQPSRWVDGFGYDAGGWTEDKYPRVMADVNGDGLADVVGFGDRGVIIATSNGNSFNPPSEWVHGLSQYYGWYVGKNPRMMADVNGDGLADVVGFGNDGVHVATSKGRSKLLTTITNGLGGQTQIEYKPLTDSTVYTKEVTETENNGTANSANGLGSTDVVVGGNISSSSDEDWFAFDIPSSRAITISVASDNNQNLDWYLCQESNLSQWVARGNSTNNPEEGTYNATNPGRYYLKINGYGGATSPYTLTLHSSDTIVRVQNSLYVVSQHTIKDKATNPTNTFVYDHQYEGAKVDRHRGWLGFEKTILIDKQNQTKTITTHHTDFPLLGMMDDREIWDLEHSGDMLGKMASSYESSPKDSNGIYKFWKTAVDLEHYTEGTYNYTLKRTYEYDSNHQNATVTSDLGDVTTDADDVYTCLAYENGTGGDWWKSFYPSHQKIVNSAAGCNNFSNWNASTDLRWERFGYDGQMNLTSHGNWRDKSGPDDTQGKWLTTTTGYDAYGNVISLTDPLGHTSTTTYESQYHTFPRQRTTPSTSAGGSLTVSTSYEPKFGIKTQVVDPNGHTTMAIADSGIDGFGRILEIQGIKPDSNDLVTLNYTVFLAEASGMSVKSYYRTDWNKNTSCDSTLRFHSEYSIDKLGFDPKDLAGGGYTTTMEIPDNPESQGNNTPDNTCLWDREYIDGLGRTYQTESKGNDGQTITNTVQFNSVGQTAKKSLPYYAGETGNFLAYEYNVHGYLIQTTDPVGAVTQINYDRLHDDRQTTYYSPDPRNNASGTDLVQSLVKDTSRSWVKEKQQPNGSSASYSYDRLGQVTTITDPLGQNTNMAYNSLGQLISETTAETGTTKYSYNDNGKLASQLDAKGQEISLEYDNLGRVSRKQVYNSDSSLAKTITYQYDDPNVDNGKGALTKIVMPEATYTFSYNNRGEVKEEAVKIDTDGNGSPETYLSQYTYDAAGRPETITYPDGAVVRHSYHEGGELHTVALQDTAESNFTDYATYDNYTALGDIGQVVYNPNQVESNYTYDAIGRITTSTTTKNAHTYFNFNYTWNKANKLRAITDNAQKGLSQNFGYDMVGRLESASGPYPNLSYEYDFAGNITKRNDTTYSYKTDKKHQLAAATYDANGNTTQYAPWSYSYDPQNRLSQVDKAGSGTVNQFTYDDSGNRLSKTEAEDGTTTYYVAPLYEVVRKADNAQIHTKYILGPQGTIAAISKNGSNVNLLAAIHANGARLEASLYNPNSWGGLAKFVQGKLNQLAFAAHVDQSLVAFVLISWLLCALLLWLYRVWRSASPDSWTGKNRARVARALASLGWIAPETAPKLHTPDNPGWLLQTWHRPVSFALALVSFSTVSLTGSSVLAASLTPGANGAGYPVAGETLFFHYDQLGSTTLVTDENANQVSQINYEPYGAIADSSTGQDAFRPKFTGKEYDSNSELYYFGARYYDGHLGRFLTPDPARQYFSPYVYGNGDPLSGIDPNGAQFIALLIIGIGALVGGYMGGAAVNHSYNPASWDWSSGKTWGGIIGGAAIGGAAAGVGAVAGGAIAAAGLGTIGTTVAEMAVAGGVMGTMNASFTAMAGGSIGDVAKSFGIGFGMGALFAMPGVGQVAFAGMVGYDTYKTIADPSVGNGIQLGIDILFLGMEAGMRLSEGGREYAEVGGCASFVAGTEVATSQGEKAIEEIAVGDTVLAYDEETGEEREYPVTHLFTRIAPESIVVTVGEEEITTTPEHEFYTANGWIEAEDLSVGDTLVRLGGKTATVTDLESHQDSTRVYNFEVDEAHTYYVSGEQVLVHNIGCLGDGRGEEPVYNRYRNHEVITNNGRMNEREFINEIRGRVNEGLNQNKRFLFIRSHGRRNGDTFAELPRPLTREQAIGERGEGIDSLILPSGTNSQRTNLVNIELASNMGTEGVDRAIQRGRWNDAGYDCVVLTFCHSEVRYRRTTSSFGRLLGRLRGYFSR